jgi:hypothetical protein
MVIAGASMRGGSHLMLRCDGKFRRNKRAAAGVLLKYIQMRRTMKYRVYSGPRGSAAISALDQQGMLFKEYDTLDGALGWARHLAESGRVALLIEGDDGTRLDKQQIAAALSHSEHAPFAHDAVVGKA